MKCELVREARTFYALVQRLPERPVILGSNRTTHCGTPWRVRVLVGGTPLLVLCGQRCPCGRRTGTNPWNPERAGRQGWAPPPTG